MPRLLFEKTRRAVWISHLDLMRLFQRAFKRAGLPLTHTQGFNPRPSVSIALPLSVGTQSHCELLDFSLDGKMPPLEEVRDRLNAALVEGVRVLEVYETARKVRDLSLLRCQVVLEYDHGFAEGIPEAIGALFQRESLLVSKKTKSGMQDQDILPMIRQLNVSAVNGQIILDAMISCQNPALNPTQLVAAIERYLPEMAPDFSRCNRLEIYDADQKLFR